MNLKKSGTVAIAAIVVLMVGSHIFANQAFAISTIPKIIDSVVAGPFDYARQWWDPFGIDYPNAGHY